MFQPHTKAANPHAPFGIEGRRAGAGMGRGIPLKKKKKGPFWVLGAWIKTRVWVGGSPL